MRRKIHGWIVILFLTAAAQAQEPAPLTLQQEAQRTQTEENGWHPALNLGANIAFGSSSNVVGQPDGDSKTLGLNLDGSLLYVQNQHEIQNELKIKEAATKTPTLSQYVKSSDELKLSSLYLYSLEAYPWLGPYVKLSADTSIFIGEDAQVESVTYQISDQNGANARSVTSDSLRLTDGLKPLTTKESVGVFSKLIHRDNMNLIARLGVGALQVDASGQLAIDDDDATPEIEVDRLQSFQQAGLEGGLQWTGNIDQKTAYTVNFEFLTPFVKDLEPGDNRDDLELTNLELTAKLTSKIYEWMAFNYEYNLKREPQLVDATQVQHQLNINFAYSLF